MLLLPAMETFTVRMAFYPLFYAEEKRRSVIEKAERDKNYECRKQTNVVATTTPDPHLLAFL